MWKNLAAIEDRAISDEHTKGMCSLSWKVEKLRDTGLQKIMRAPTVNKDGKMGLVNGAVEAGGVRGGEARQCVETDVWTLGINGGFKVVGVRCIAVGECG